ncbi:MAG: glycosyltransferase family 2 protein, partial [Planctomycetota bacterium]|nr:glycosyltransferase family 2 protein [Planctomycetota bacterium]
MDHSAAGIELSLIAPVYNEEENIMPFLEEADAALAKLGRPYEIIAVDDGSTDRSRAMLVEAKKRFPALRVLALDRNHGQSAAFDAGLRASRGRVLVTIDSDMQNDPADIGRLVEALEKHGVDGAVGWRVNRRDNFLRKISSRIANFVRNRLSRETVRDVGCSLKAFRREAILRCKLFKGMHRFLPTLVRMEGGTIVEVPVNHRP